MSAADALQRPLDAQSNQVNNLGDPGASTDATHVSSDVTQIQKIGTTPKLGSSFQAAPADHGHTLPEGIDIQDFLQKFRTLLFYYVAQGNPIPPGLEDEYVTAQKYVS